MIKVLVNEEIDESAEAISWIKEHRVLQGFRDGVQGIYNMGRMGIF